MAGWGSQEVDNRVGWGSQAVDDTVERVKVSEIKKIS